jgi:uncharacterized protein YbgA (DUF1722 family)/uncharacterized protein YbbK (DUF523 family)
MMHSVESPVRLGVSACLLGSRVRYDGGHQRDHFTVDILGPHVTWHAVCPEVGIGLGTPRETIRLEGTPAAPRLVPSRGGDDLSDAMREFAAAQAADLADAGISGYVLKSRSPSCGAFRVKVYGDSGQVSKAGRGIFAQVLMSTLPLLPVEEDGRLNDAGLRENFVERIFAYHRWQLFRESMPGRGDLVRFHTQHKLQLLSHGREGYGACGRLVAEMKGRRLDSVLDEYGTLFMTTLRRRATVRRHADVLYHVLGYLKRHIDAADRAEMVALIERYRQQQVPLIVPITLLHHHIGRHAVHDWLPAQTYLAPYPQELMLRNHV